MPSSKKCIPLVAEVLKSAKIEKEEIDDVVLVGGSTRIPSIQNELSEYFGGIPLQHSINPDEAVAVGAAIHAAQLADGTAKSHTEANS